MTSVVYGQNYYLYCVGIGCLLNCPIADQNCPAWVSGKTIEINEMSLVVPSMSNFTSALSIQFLGLQSNVGPGSTVVYQNPVGIATFSNNQIPEGSDTMISIGPSYLSMQEFQFQNSSESSPAPTVMWNVCNGQWGSESDFWQAGNKVCQLPSKSLNAFNDLVDQWVLIPARTLTGDGNVSLGDVLAITLSPLSTNVIPSELSPSLSSVPIGVFTNNSNNLLTDLQNPSEDNYTGIVQPLVLNNTFLNIVNSQFFGGDPVTVLDNAVQFCPTSTTNQTTTFYFIITDQNGSTGSIPLQPPLFYNCPCSITSCTLCNVPGQMAFLDPISGQKCPVSCSQSSSGGPCTFQLIEGGCPACGANNCSPACGNGQVCERNLSTGACECVNIPSAKNKVIWLIVIISVIILAALILIILLIVRNRKEKKAADAFQKSLIQGILQSPST